MWMDCTCLGVPIENLHRKLLKYCSRNPSFIQVIIESRESAFTLESQIEEIRDLIMRLSGTVQGTSNNVPLASYNPNSSPRWDSLRIQLPKLQLPAFYGDPLKWIEFWDAFEAAVHRQDIPPVQKFSYLLSNLRGSAYKAIEGIAVTNATYNDAIEILKNRFGDNKVIKRGLYSQLKAMPKSTSKTLDLRHTLENIERITRQLKSLREDLEQPALMMLILEKLPTDILIKLGEMKPAHKEWTVDLLSHNLNEIIRNKEEAYQISNFEHKSQKNSGFECLLNRNNPKKDERKVETTAAAVDVSCASVTNENPADIATRFTDSSGFNNELWLHGPQWLMTHEWPIESIDPKDITVEYSSQLLEEDTTLLEEDRHEEEEDEHVPVELNSTQKLIKYWKETQETLKVIMMKICIICKEKTHAWCHCPSNKSDQEKFCFICKKVTHNHVLCGYNKKKSATLLKKVLNKEAMKLLLKHADDMSKNE
uniref:Uncharacterized protein n=1 Tax=Romanomermis culicivorax TaxID=13658 RepID=A0A915IC80_ROMCU